MLHQTLQFLVEAYAARGDPDGARDALQMSRDRGFKPDAYGYTALIDAYGRVCAARAAVCYPAAHKPLSPLPHPTPIHPVI